MKYREQNGFLLFLHNIKPLVQNWTSPGWEIHAVGTANPGLKARPLVPSQATGSE